ncbi:hypothetical protein ANACAC_00957 [Anaerostipes caccae L1-92]|uniref:Uncharacterized protein n=1 Tax=Anaerostipes caccae (strain DSM 14662 / CCUG 47493 / JCM 13470 / NCIMB 13811 / L1-92) TaxID=411490 RepID=B0MC15_ANACD|nr:hypothetical protein ANACAC_00957 [Anaerostipes caccae L1-92]
MFLPPNIHRMYVAVYYITFFQQDNRGLKSRRKLLNGKTSHKNLRDVFNSGYNEYYAKEKFMLLQIRLFQDRRSGRPNLPEDPQKLFPVRFPDSDHLLPDRIHSRMVRKDIFSLLLPPSINLFIL